MDNIQFWLYVIVAIIALIAQIRKKKQVQEEQNSPPVRRARPAENTGQERPRQGAQPVSFEDLLKEILEAKEPSPAPAPAYTSYEAEPTPAPAYKSYRSDEEIGEIFERSRRDAATSDLQGMTSDLKGRVSELGSKHFMQYEVEETDTAASGILSELKSAGGLKKAVIYSEILNRKHF